MVSPMLMRTDPFRELDRLSETLFGTMAGPSGMAMDAYRSGDEYLVQVDLPGVDPDSVELTVEQNVLTIKAERKSPLPDGAEVVVGERRFGVFNRQLFLGESLNVDKLHADYEAGVLTIKIPVAEQAKPRKIEIKRGSDHKQIAA
jgi:HSP20 family protein